MTDVFEQTISGWPAQAQVRFGEIRALIRDVARTLDVGPIEESLKWRQPAWRPTRPRTGSTLRLNWDSGASKSIALFVDCKTTLASEMFAAYPYDFAYESNPALRLALDATPPRDAIRFLAERTFSYHCKH